MKPFVYFTLKDKSDVFLSNILLLFIYSKLLLFKLSLIKVMFTIQQKKIKNSCCLQKCISFIGLKLVFIPYKYDLINL